MIRNVTMTINKRINNIKTIVQPEAVLQELPASAALLSQIEQSRQAIKKIINGKSPKFLVIVGPCSIHDPQAAIDYAKKLKKLSSYHKDKLEVLMRVYFEKPRTTLGWKGLINDPFLDNTHDINQGLWIARRLLLKINEVGINVATEFVDTFTPQYLADLTSWAAIGARTTESQMHRMLASGLSMPVGFKNSTAGCVKTAINSMSCAASPHQFLGINQQGQASVINTSGNPDTHVVLRGGSSGPNYETEQIQNTLQLLKQHNKPKRVLIDCSHDNSKKDYKQQKHVIHAICKQLTKPDNGIMGVMIESNLVEGKQSLRKPSALIYGQSITDSCIGWDETEQLINALAQHC